jgi:hypothetical protein
MARLEGGAMRPFVNLAMVAAGVMAVSAPVIPAAGMPQAPAAAPARVNACTVASKEEVRKHLPWAAMLDQFPVEEERIGAAGSGCEFPSVRVQVLPFSQGTIDQAKRQGGLEPVSGIGEEAYFHNNRNLFAELYVKSGRYLVTLQAGWDGKNPGVKTGVQNLAKVLVTKLR